jgi:hypothetical protein
MRTLHRNTNFEFLSTHLVGVKWQLETPGIRMGQPSDYVRSNRRYLWRVNHRDTAGARRCSVRSVWRIPEAKSLKARAK